MLYELKALIGSPVIATDGETGSIRTFLFDDQSWKVSYLVIDVGGWLKRRDVVLPITALEQPNWETGLSVSISGLPSTCFFESDTSKRPTRQFVSITDKGDMSTCRPPSQPPVSTVR
jgi:hypothetical protein